MNIVEQSKNVMLQFGASPVMYFMIGLSVVSVAIMVERAWFFWANTGELKRLVTELGRHLGKNDVAGARRLVESDSSVEASVVLAGLQQVDRGADAADEAMAAATVMGRLRLEQRLSFLGTLGNNAPFVGLLGTVIGIVQAFDQLERSGASAGGGSEVMGAIAEALVATAIGLCVAIPAVAAFNAFQRRIKQALSNCEALSHVLLAYLKGARCQPEQDEPDVECECSPSQRFAVDQIGV